MTVIPPVTKVAIYVVHEDDVLMFTEPDFPDVPPQIPGGTVEPGEDLSNAALRELREETGLLESDIATLTALGSVDYDLWRGGEHIHQRRHFYLATLAIEPRRTWEHWEMTPSGGAQPIRFSYVWLPLAAARATLGLGFADRLDAVSACLDRTRDEG